jgi:putative ABC transport system permease protein
VKNPGFTAMAVLILALGLGANTAIFSVVNSLLLRPFPFPQLDRLMLIWETGGADQSQEKWTAPADFIDLRSEVRSFEALAAYNYKQVNLSDAGEVEGTFGVVVSPNFFEALGAQPALGRTFRPEEEQEGQDQVVVVSHAFWQHRFGGDPNVLGKTLQINGRSFTVVGVMPPSFDFPPAMPLWMPIALGQQEKMQRATPTFDLLGRLRPGVSSNQAQQELRSFAGRLERQYPTTNTDRSMALLPLRRYQYKYTAPLFLMLQAAAGFLLLLACANLVNLLFSRMIGRQKEIAIREALGAGRKHLARLLLSETMLLSL